MFDSVNTKPPTGSRGQAIVDWLNSLDVLQKTGVFGAIVMVILPAFMDSTTVDVVIDVCALSVLLLGFVTSSLWRARHALHFGYSTAFACALHVCLVPLYAWLMKERLQPNLGANWETALLVLSILLVAGEKTLLVHLVKRVAVRLYRKRMNSRKVSANGATT